MKNLTKFFLRMYGTGTVHLFINMFYLFHDTSTDLQDFNFVEVLNLLIVKVE